MPGFWKPKPVFYWGFSSYCRPQYGAGHFYSPVVDVAEALRDQAQIWPEAPVFTGVDYRDSAQLEVLHGPFAQFMPQFDYPQSLAKGEAEDHFYLDNSQFSHLDCRALYVLLRWLRPRRMIEIGSGYSSLLAADVNQRFLDGAVDITCVEPYPRPFLARGLKGISRLVESRLQDVPLEDFDVLEAGDILFVDSSHVSKTGSDVNRIILQILPRLKRGVVVHFHDIFLPWDYRREWVVEDGRSWNEQYLLQAFLMSNPRVQVLFACHYMARKHPHEVMPYCTSPGGGVSFWLRMV